MRITSGLLAGRAITSNSRATHPMSEVMRLALFNTLGDISGLSFLDVFSGSGAVGIEALSRGAIDVELIESNKKSQTDIIKNLQSLNLALKIKLDKMSLSSWLSFSSAKFNLIFCDPPYNDLHLADITKLEKHLIDNGVLILSLPPKSNLPDFVSLSLNKEKNYGDSRLVYYLKDL